MGCGDLRRLGAVTGGDTDLSIITGSWRSDLFLLIKVARDTELNVNFYTYYAVRKGALTAPGASGLDQVKHVGVWNANNQGFVGWDIVDDFRKRYSDDFTWMRARALR